MVHIECLREKAKKSKSNNENVKCPKCGALVQDFELNQFLTDEDKKEIEDSQKMAIVKLNPNFVSCSCGNVMEFEPGQI